MVQASPISKPQDLFGRGKQLAELCGDAQYYRTSNGYGLNNNAWGAGSATGGSQCTWFQALTKKGVAWRSTWEWQGGEGMVKSYPYAGKVFTPKIIDKFTTMGSYLAWSYDNEDIVADVAYDLFSNSDPKGGTTNGEFEVMIWLAAYGGARPISESGSPVASPKIEGYTWDLYDGYNGDMHVYSFVVKDGPIRKFGADVKKFYTWLAQNKAFPIASQYLMTFQAGTEPFKGYRTTFSVGEFNAILS
ncbi:concanavalin A-like lectin/glucanase [Pseudovirgaria hyperparasitica]|uniref:Concanavalin A-like lectin/glucanase n=1 Tax=Pseudovirgaria hyperparasitica TaxID=470096 RepID=A0A6A6W7R9_9PEZI|nr:concanavalin A-like lectin/glucanase [Pseudovirgaria hyperparasitica]KAF2758000.1 concanavalin A-like lectin/glucanase [Pseudovirgaria hyperparasitica]